ncbi:MAG: hypothetical protein AB8G11_00475 [Saprospiraceae bacterium]
MNNIDVNKVTTTIDTAIKELQEGLNPDLLSKEDKVELIEDVEDVIKLALKIKLQYQQRRMNDLMNALDNDENVDIDRIQTTSDAIGKALDLIKAA